MGNLDLLSFSVLGQLLGLTPVAYMSPRQTSGEMAM